MVRSLQPEVCAGGWLCEDDGGISIKHCRFPLVIFVFAAHYLHSRSAVSSLAFYARKRQKTTAGRFAVKYCEIILALLGSLMFYLWIVGKYSGSQSLKNRIKSVELCRVSFRTLDFTLAHTHRRQCDSSANRNRKKKLSLPLINYDFTERYEMNCVHTADYVINNGTCAAGTVVRLLRATHSTQ